MLFSVCSAVTVERFVPVLHGRVWYVCCYVRKKALLQCLWERDDVSQPPCVRYYVFVKSSFKHTREECESKRAYVF